ncbi:MAG TPA: hypothetical protein IAB45_00470 [Candidatus Onthousia faecavium]|nr:hypothetical protein [Candidatus Onthousia faecavium]
MKRSVNNKGWGSYEFLTVVVVCLILTIILLFVVFRLIDDEKFQVFKYNARTIGINAIDYQINSDFDTVYLYELVDDGYVTKMKNAFSGDKYCDLYESKVEFTDNAKKVTLRCGEYLIYEQDVADEDYDIYKITDWSSKEMKGDNIDENTVYNIIVDGKEIFNEYYEEELFIKQVMAKYGKEYSSLNKIKKAYDVKEEEVYRERVLVN